MKKTTMKMLSFALLVCMLAGMASTASAGWSVLTQRRLQLENTRRELDLNLNRHRDGDWQYDLDSDGNAKILRYLGSETQVAVPETLTDEEGNVHPVTLVYAIAFGEEVEFTLPEGIEMFHRALIPKEMEAPDKTEPENGFDGMTEEELEEQMRNIEQQLKELEEQLKGLQEAPESAKPKYEGIG